MINLSFRNFKVITLQLDRTGSKPHPASCRVQAVLIVLQSVASAQPHFVSASSLQRRHLTLHLFALHMREEYGIKI